jgi:hypothetical protein
MLAAVCRLVGKRQALPCTGENWNKTFMFEAYRKKITISKYQTTTRQTSMAACQLP